MKRILAATLASLAALGATTAQAQTVTGNFNVNINLTSVCQLSTVNDVQFNYTSFQGSAQASTGGGFTVTCTNTLPYTMALTGASVTDDAVNLAYTLSVPAGGTGNGAAQAYSVSGTMAANQAGTCATGTCTNAAATNRTKTLTITY